MTVINIDELKEIMDNDTELIQECFAEFLSDYPDMIAEVRSAVDQKDCEMIDSCSHKLKGTLRYLAAPKAAAAAQALELAGREQDMENLGVKLSDLEAACREVIITIDELDL